MVVMLTTTAIALAAAGAALLFTDLRDNRAAWADDLAHRSRHSLAGRATRAVVQRSRRRAAQPECAAGARVDSRRGALRRRRQPVRAIRRGRAKRRRPPRLPRLSRRACTSTADSVELVTDRHPGRRSSSALSTCARSTTSRARARLSERARRRDDHRPDRRLARLELAAPRGEPADGIHGQRRAADRRETRLLVPRGEDDRRRNRRGHRRIQQDARRSAVAFARARDQREAVSRHRRIHQLRRVGHRRRRPQHLHQRFVPASSSA